MKWSVLDHGHCIGQSHSPRGMLGWVSPDPTFFWTAKFNCEFYATSQIYKALPEAQVEFPKARTQGSWARLWRCPDHSKDHKLVRTSLIEGFGSQMWKEQRKCDSRVDGLRNRKGIIYIMGQSFKDSLLLCVLCKYAFHSRPREFPTYSKNFLYYPWWKFCFCFNFSKNR